MADTKVKKTIIKKTVKKTVKPAVVKTAKPASITKAVSLKLDVVDVKGVKNGTVDLPKEVFGVTPNKALIAQAVRVYLANQRQGTSSTKTRGEVKGSTRKIYRQKGTGKARHGAITAPIFVGGGITFGPKPRDFEMKFPKKMKKQALFSALSEKASTGAIRVIEGDFSGKTKEVASLLKKLNLTDKRGKVARVLLVVDGVKKTVKASKNIGGLSIESAKTVTTYTVVTNKNIIFIKNAINDLVSRYDKVEN